jgi:hypothetical protein
MEGGQDPFGCLRVSRGRIERCWTLKAPSSRAILGGRCGGRPPTASGPGRRDSGPSGHEPLGGHLEPWWCTPTTSRSRASRGRSRRQRRPRSPREQRALRAVCRVTEDRAGSAARAPPKRWHDGSSSQAEASRWKLALGPSNGEGGDGRRVSWSETMCAVSASLRIEPGPQLERRPFWAARRSQPAGRSSSLDGGLRATRGRVGTARR